MRVEYIPVGQIVNAHGIKGEVKLNPIGFDPEFLAEFDVMYIGGKEVKIGKKVVVIGGGVIGMEMASYFNSVGSKVTVIEMLDHIAGPTDLEISKMLQKEYAARGVEEDYLGMESLEGYLVMIDNPTPDAYKLMIEKRASAFAVIQGKHYDAHAADRQGCRCLRLLAPLALQPRTRG